MDYVEFSWLKDGPSFKDALKETLGCSGQLIKRFYSSKEQDRKIKSRDMSRLSLDLVNHMQINPQYIGPPVTIITETPEYLVLHKPPGVHCHPHRYSDKDSLLNFLAESGKWEALQVNSSEYDRGLLYRLDFETSGVIILSKSEKIFKNIRSNFALHMKRKFYWAVVDGDFNQDGLWTHYLRASGHKGVKQKVSDTPYEDSQEASMSVLRITTNQDKSLLLVNLKTGLRHQIRAQLSHLGFPILGDELYGGRKADRLFLHALRYEWLDVVEDPNPELFQLFFDMNGALQMSHDMLRRF